MTVALTGAGSWGVRVGHLGGAILDALALQGGAATVRVLATAKFTTRQNTISVDYTNGTNRADLVNALSTNIASWRSGQASLLTYFASVISSTTIGMADDDTKLVTKSITAALVLLNSQMVSAVASIQASTVAAGSQTNVGSPVGSVTIVKSVIRGDGLTLQTPFAEIITFSTTADAQTGSQTARQEQITASTPTATSTELDYLWPLGSAISVTLYTCDAMLSNAGTQKNYLQNSSFETFTTANVPDNWTVVVGTAGTDFAKEATTIYGDGGTGALKFIGGTAVNTSFTQAFGTTPSTTLNAGGTSATLKPSSPFVATSGILPVATGTGVPYALNFYLKCDVVPAAGVITVDLVDGTPTVINDDQAVANTLAITLSGTSTSYVAKNTVFRLPVNLPTTIKLRVRASTAISAGTNVYIDSMSLTPMTQLYAGGPFVACFAGATKTIFGDQFTITTTNTMGVMAQVLEQALAMRSLGIQLPYSGSPTVSDALVL